MKHALLVVLCLIVLLAGCTRQPSQKELAELDYGMPLTIDCRAVIKNYFDRVLYDPYSAHYEFDPPHKSWYREPLFEGNKLYAGYIVFVWVNAKNRMGGYTGAKRYGFLFKNNEIIKIIDPGDIF